MHICLALPSGIVSLCGIISLACAAKSSLGEHSPTLDGLPALPVVSLSGSQVKVLAFLPVVAVPVAFLSRSKILAGISSCTATQSANQSSQIMDVCRYFNFSVAKLRTDILSQQVR